MIWRAAVVALATMLGSAISIAADMIYVSSVPTVIERSQRAGSLYSVQLPGGAVASVGAMTVDARPITVTGLAVHPATGVLYGITSDASPNHPHSLVTLDRETAKGKLVGPLGTVGSDIAFDATGALYVWLRETSQLGMVDIASGKVSAVGPVRPPSEPGGITIDVDGRIYLLTSGGAGSVDHIDPASGVVTLGPSLKGAPYPAGINSIAISPGGELYAVNSNRGSPAKSALIRIDPKTGAVTPIGALPDDADAIVLVHTPWSLAEFLATRDGMTLVIALVLLVLAGAYIAYYRSGRNRR